MSVRKLERNVRIYMGRSHGVPLVEIARIENISPQRVYQIITATEYQLALGNQDYWNELKSNYSFSHN